MPIARPIQPVDAPDSGPRARTWRLLLSEAMTLMHRGRIPSVADVAQSAGVSRATAYRYFPSRSKLIAAVVGESLGPVRRFHSDGDDGLARLRALFDQTFPRFKEFEPQLRAALLLALEHQSLERVGQLDEEPFRRGHRREILRRTAAPLRPALGERGFDRLVKALSVVYGIESYVVLKDIWGASDRETEAVARWMLDALIEHALREATGRSALGSSAPAKSSPPAKSTTPAKSATSAKSAPATKSAASAKSVTSAKSATSAIRPAAKRIPD